MHTRNLEVMRAPCNVVGVISAFFLCGLAFAAKKWNRSSLKDFQFSWKRRKGSYLTAIRANAAYDMVELDSFDIRGGKTNIMGELLVKMLEFFMGLLGLGAMKSNMSWSQEYSVERGKMGKRRKTMLDHLKMKYKPGDPSFRIQKELRSFIEKPPLNCKVTIGQNMKVWIITMTGADGTIYAGEKYKLKVTFPKDYPSKPPSVYFLKPCPKHMHVYSNGDICLSLLGKGWRPQMTVESIAVSILSILSNAKEKKLPPDNAMHSDNLPGQQQEGWMYHDDRC